MERKWGWLLTAAVAMLVLAPVIFTFYTDYLWFAGLGLASVFTTELLYQVGTGIAVFLISLSTLSALYRWTTHVLQKASEDTPPLGYSTVTLLSVFIGFIASSSWPLILRFVNQQPFGTADPVFGLDIGFYVFSLPFYDWLVWLLFVILFLGAGGALLVYALRFGTEEYEVVESRTGQTIQGNEFNLTKYVEQLREHAFTQLSCVFALLFFLYGIATWLDRYALLLDSYGTVFGLGYTQSSIILPLLTLSAVVAVLGALATAGNAFWQRRHVATAVVAVLVLLAIGGNLTGSVVQNYIVEPDEFNTEREYIEHEINHTNAGFGLQRMDETDFTVSNTSDPLDGQDTTLDNIRLWDWRPLLTTYNELQIFRSYYTFTDVDVDRYRIEGDLTQVMLAPRELDYSNLPTRSWVNEHLVYTHGHGLTMSPVRNVTADGLPSLMVKDIPPESSKLSIDEPAIYYGENPNRYSIVNTETEEFDYPSGDENKYTEYAGTGGVAIDSLLDRVAFATRFGSSQIFFSGSITDDSKIQFHKNVAERVRSVAPFLQLDSDPYMVVHEGKQYWIVDAYTSTDMYPYSRPHRFKDDKVNYARNSVKVVIDAYNGDMDFYVAEEEPIVETYASAFPDLFKPLETMPDGLQRHIRYPEDLFSLQGDVYATYHMQDPRVFYNKEDQWRVPEETARGRRDEMEPYYIVMRLPGEERAEFVQIMPYVPRGKENMIGWLAARSDSPNYGEILAYHLSKQRLAYGPMQIEARISQDADISQQITLWSQSGSDVFRGNLLTIPLDNSFLYIEPLFLKSTQTGSLPELKRVIVAHRDQLTMQPTLDKALRVVFGEQEDTVTPVNRTVRAGNEQLEQARDLFDEAQSALRTGNLSLYDQKIRELGESLRE